MVILPSPLSWNFALSASRSGAPGYAPEDARDLYEVMQKTLTVLRDHYSSSPRRSIFGVSLGALEGAYLSVLDADEGKIGIANYLLINPPVDLLTPSRKSMNGTSWQKNSDREKSQQIVSKALAIVDSFSDAGRRTIPRSSTDWQRSSSEFTTEELQFLIAENLQSQLHELVYVTQVDSRSKCSDRAKRRNEETPCRKPKVSRLSIITGRSLCPYGKNSREIPRPTRKPSPTRLLGANRGSAA